MQRSVIGTIGASITLEINKYINFVSKYVQGASKFSHILRLKISHDITFLGHPLVILTWLTFVSQSKYARLEQSTSIRRFPSNWFGSRCPVCLKYVWISAFFLNNEMTMSSLTPGFGEFLSNVKILDKKKYFYEFHQILIHELWRILSVPTFPRII